MADPFAVTIGLAAQLRARVRQLRSIEITQSLRERVLVAVGAGTADAAAALAVWN
ncbi:MAG TPA: hypothetical protein VGI67_17050 [Thermoleophilaceae bacterium]